jgi:hypothetical protein
MPQLGIGIIPSAGAVATELTSVTRRAFLENSIIQIYKSTPLTCALLSTALMASGGISPITAPVQGTPMTSVTNTDYSGRFTNPGVIPAMQNAEFNLSAYIATIPFLGLEGLVQVDYSVVPLIEARMNDATNNTIDKFSTDIWNNITNNLAIQGLPWAIDDGTNVATYGGIARNTTNAAGTAWWQSTVVSNSAGATTPTRDLFMQYVMQVFKKNGEKPKMGICGVGTWDLLTRDFTPQERYNTTANGSYGMDGPVNALFDAVMIAGVPIYCDPYAPEGTLYLLNTDYLNMYIHDKAGFQFLPFESTFINGQIGWLAGVLTLLQMVNVKPQAHGAFKNLAYINI